jgi:hypothetical protein
VCGQNKQEFNARHDHHDRVELGAPEAKERFLSHCKGGDFSSQKLLMFGIHQTSVLEGETKVMIG